MTRRKDGRYQESVTINGRRKYFYGSTKAEVLKKIRAYTEEESRGPLLSGIADKWYNERITHVRYKTAESYVRPLAEIRAEFGDVDITRITSPMITRFIRDLERKGYARRTVQLRLDVMRMICRYAISDLGVLRVNPADSVKLSDDLPVSHRELASREDIARICSHRTDDRFSLLPFLLLWTGLRLGEALALTDESFHDGIIDVQQQVSWEPNQPVLAPVKTAKGVRQVPLLDVLKDALPDWKGYLFSDDGKKPLSKSAFMKRWRSYTKRTGVTCDRHSLRHEFATVLFDAQIDTKDAAEMMGHDEKVMRDIYTHIDESRRKMTSDKLNSYVNMMSSPV